MIGFKLDENLSEGWGASLVAAGCRVLTVAGQALAGADDPVVAAHCAEEGLCLVTADLDFAQIVDSPPERYAGIIVLRHPAPTLAGMRFLVEQLVTALESESPVGKLWIVEPGRLRIHDSSSPESP